MKKIGWLICFLFIISNSQAQTETERKTHFNLEKNVAIKGYDPVGYIASNKAIEGKKEFSSLYKGIIYFFATKENQEFFKANPALYEPAYGGWCAYAMGNSGEKVEVDPETFKVIQGRTYLFYNFYFNNTLKTWNKSEATLKSKADNNWAKIITKK